MSNTNADRFVKFATETTNNLQFNQSGGPSALMEVVFLKALNCLYGEVSEHISPATRNTVECALWSEQSPKSENTGIFTRATLGMNWNDASLPERHIDAFMSALLLHSKIHPNSSAIDDLAYVIDHYPHSWERANDRMEENSLSEIPRQHLTEIECVV